MFVRKLGRMALVATLLVGAAACKDSTGAEEHPEAFGVVVVDAATSQELATVNAQRQVTGSLSVTAGGERGIKVFFLDDRGRRFQLETGGDEVLGWKVGNTAVARIAAHDGHLDLEGVAAGTTEVRFQVLHQGHADYESEPIPVVVAP